MTNLSTSIICLTLNAEKEIGRILEKIDFKKYKVLIIDSESDDNTLEICRNFNCQIHIIKRKNFNHGATREYARKLTNTDIVVFFTQDAIPVYIESIDKLISPIIDGRTSVSYGKQIPNHGASIFESFPREFNYGDDFEIRSIKDVNKYGVYTFFCSDSFSAYSNKDLDLVGGIETALVSEDYFTVAKLLQKGKKISYVPEAKVFHSHKYTLKQEFCRMFDTGYVRAERPWVQDVVGTVNKRGMIYFTKLIKRLLIYKIYLIPYAILVTISKWLGFKIGYSALNFPISIKKKLSGQSYYFNSKYFTKYK